jgi:membrane fusion protein (multidrug efflux system)
VRLGQEVRVEVDTFPGETFTGRITAVNPRIDPRTRALQVQAELPNPDSLLLPGMFVRANVALPNPDQLVTLPITAVAFTTFGDSVYVVEKTEDGNAVAKQVAVRTAGRRGNQVAIAEGVQPGMEIVTSGQMKLRNNSPIRINNSIELPSGATAQVEER